MVRTNSTMLPLGTLLPEFDLEVVQDTNICGFFAGQGLNRITNQDLTQNPLLIMVICAHCPFVKHIETAITNLSKDYGNQIQILGVSSNSLITHPQDGPQNLADQANQFNWHFPYLLDSDQSFAKALRAACTPDFFLFSVLDNDQHKLRYRGQLDGSSPGNQIPPTGKDLRGAIKAVLEEDIVCEEQKPSIGCNIKWHPGMEPEWFG